MTIDEIYTTFKNFKEITKGEYFKRVMDRVAETEVLTDFIMDFDLQGKGKELPGVLGDYTDFLNNYESTNIGSDGDLYRNWGKELFMLYCSTFFETSDGDLVQVGTLEYTELAFTHTYLKSLCNLSESMEYHAKEFGPCFMEDYKYFLTPDGSPAAVPAEVLIKPQKVSSDTKAAYT